MDDYVTVFDSRSDGVSKFESVQSRFDRLHIPRKDLSWVLCNFCGNLVNKILYESHIVQHDLIDLTYSLYHFELAEETKMLKMSKRIQKKEKRRQRKNHSLVGLDVEEDTGSDSSSSSTSWSSSSESSSSNSFDSINENNKQQSDFSLPGCSTSSIAVQPRKCKKVERKVMAVKKEQKKGEERTKEEERKEKRRKAAAVKKKAKRNAASLSSLNGVVKEQKVEQQRPEGHVAGGTGMDNKPSEDKVKMEHFIIGEEVTRIGQTQQQKAEIVEQTEDDDGRWKREAEEQKRAVLERNRHNKEANRKRRLRAVLEMQMMRRYLGPNHHRVFVDNSAALAAFFDRRTGNLSLDSLRLPPQNLRRSRRGVITEERELHCLF